MLGCSPSPRTGRYRSPTSLRASAASCFPDFQTCLATLARVVTRWWPPPSRNPPSAPVKSLIALARASSLQTVSVTIGTKSELRSTFKPTPRGTYVTAPGMCAWSETRRGVCYYASRATGGRVVQFDAIKGEVIAVVDCDAGAGSGGPWCVAVTERAGRDALAVGTARGVEFLSVNGDGVVSGGVSGKKTTERDVRDGERREARGVDGRRGGRVGVQRDVRVPGRRPVRTARK